MPDPIPANAPPPVGEEVLSAGERQFELRRKLAGIVAAPLAFAIAYTLCDGLTPQGRTLSAILAGVVALWVSELIPLPVTALLGAALCVVLGVSDARTVLAYFGDPIIFVFLGGFILARAMSVHGLDRRIALYFLSIPIVGSSRMGMLAGLGFVTAFLSMWVSNSATTAMMLPIGLGMLSAIHRMRQDRGEVAGPMDAARWPFATGMMLMIAYSASIGGIGTPVGSPPNLIALGLLRKSAGIDVSFFEWMTLCVPLLAAMGVLLFFLLYAMHRDPAATKSNVTGGEVLAYIRQERRKIGPWTRGQVNTLVAFAVAVTLWVLPGVLALPWLARVDTAVALSGWMRTHMPESIVALLAASLLFLLPTRLRSGEFTLTWRDAQQIDWGTILLFGGGLAMGSLMFDTKVATAMGDALTGRVGASSLWTLTAVSIALAIVLSETTSNTASANMVIPVAIAISQGAGVDPLPPAMGACLGASYGFMLPVSTPPNAIVYGSGLVPLGRMMRAGIVFDVLGFAVIFAGLRVLYPLLKIT